jgi:cytochrome bd-type quinol oxidase subunit 2
MTCVILVLLAITFAIIAALHGLAYVVAKKRGEPTRRNLQARNAALISLGLIGLVVLINFIPVPDRLLWP